jgi:hypothetical protein
MLANSRKLGHPGVIKDGKIFENKTNEDASRSGNF